MTTTLSRQLFKPLLEDEPDDPDDLENYLDAKAISMSVKDILCESMVPELRNQFDDLAYLDSRIHELILNLMNNGGWASLSTLISFFLR